MDCVKIGNLIKQLRLEKKYTQKELGDLIHVSDKTISKWENGNGLPDITLLTGLATVLQVTIHQLLDGQRNSNSLEDNMTKTKFFVCPECKNIATSTGDISLSCCGRPLSEAIPMKATEEQKLQVEKVENDWYITSEHPMEKENYIRFVAFLTGDRLQLLKQYPEWNLSVRIQNRGHGKIFWYSDDEGLLYQLV